jgi:PGF-pre-PGF domain-containing protein
MGDGTLLRLDVSGAVVTVTSGKAQISIPEITAGKTVMVTIKRSEETSVKTMQISVKNNVSNIQVTLTKLDEKPVGVSADVVGSVYHYLNVDKQNVNDEDISNAKIGFQVEKLWLDSNNVDSSTVSLQRYAEGRWNKLPTSKVGEDAVNVYYEAESSGLSIFVISGELPWMYQWGWVLAALALVIFVGSSSVFLLKKKRAQDVQRSVGRGLGGGGRSKKSRH